MNVDHVMICVLSVGFGVCAMDTVNDWRQVAQNEENRRIVAVCTHRGGVVQVDANLKPICAAQNVLRMGAI